MNPLCERRPCQDPGSPVQKPRPAVVVIGGRHLCRYHAAQYRNPAREPAWPSTVHDIVRRVAAMEPPLDSESGSCLWCPVGAPSRSSSQGDAWEPGDHNPGCPWRLAVEYMAVPR
jgi:hypothetical protein